jgi:hypothetical protein
MSGDAKVSGSGRDVFEASVVASRDQVRAPLDAATSISWLTPSAPQRAGGAHLADDRFRSSAV